MTSRPDPDASPPAPSIADVIATRREEILRAFAERARRDLREGLSPSSLIDSLPSMLDALVELLRAGPRGRAPGEPPRVVAIAWAHGAERATTNIDAVQLIWEYGVLRDVILDEVERAGARPTVREVRILTDVMTTGIAESVRKFIADREESLRQLHAFEQQLVGIVSHDLRNPLNVVLLGASSMLARGDLSDMDRTAVARIRSAAERATRLIGDLLDLTQARLGEEMPLRLREADLEVMARQVIEETRAVFPGREIRLEIAAPCGGRWDPNRVAQVIENLVTNALKYGRAGTPVTVRLTPTEHEIQLCVHNLGEPIPPAALATIFEPGGRASDDPTGRSVGLGLFIVDRIAAAHGGRVEVSSSADEGTTFTVHLPRG